MSQVIILLVEVNLIREEYVEDIVLYIVHVEALYTIYVSERSARVHLSPETQVLKYLCLGDTNV